MPIFDATAARNSVGILSPKNKFGLLFLFLSSSSFDSFDFLCFGFGDVSLVCSNRLFWGISEESESRVEFRRRRVLERDEELEESVSDGLERGVDFDGLRLQGFFSLGTLLRFSHFFRRWGHLVRSPW